jgi:hypothetical protein
MRMELKLLEQSNMNRDSNMGNLSHIQKSRDTDWPIGCTESESKSGISSGYPMCKGGPETSIVVVRQRGGIHIPGPDGGVIPCHGLALNRRGATVHTTCH